MRYGIWSWPWACRADKNVRIWPGRTTPLEFVTFLMVWTVVCFLINPRLPVYNCPSSTKSSLHQSHHSQVVRFTSTMPALYKRLAVRPHTRYLLVALNITVKVPSYPHPLHVHMNSTSPRAFWNWQLILCEMLQVTHRSPVKNRSHTLQQGWQALPRARQAACPLLPRHSLDFSLMSMLVHSTGFSSSHPFLDAEDAKIYLAECLEFKVVICFSKRMSGIFTTM